MASVRLRYHLEVADKPGKRLAAKLEVDAAGGKELTLAMPSWVPGSYLMREYAGHVVWLTAESGGKKLDVRKTDKNHWGVQLEGADSCTVSYEVFAPDLTVRSNDITHDHAFINPAGAFVQVVGRENEPATLTIAPPAGWNVAVALEPVGGKRKGNDKSFAIPDYDTLIDSPIEMGPQQLHHFEAAGVPHELVIHGTGNFDLKRMIEDTTKIIETEVGLFGEIPVDRYLFILLLTEQGMGGLEHSKSCALAWPALKFRPEIEYDRYLTLVAHEYFHLWNVKRIKPEALLTPDLTQEVYTRLLWVFEGITSYYDELIPVRASAYSAKRYLEFTAENIRAETARPGNRHQSIADSSFDTWIKLYRPTPDSTNTQVSYYQRGQMVALLLDLLIREKSGDAKSLDDVMRYLWNEIYKKGKGLSEDGFPGLVEAATRVDASDFLKTAVEGRGVLDYANRLAHVGLRTVEKEVKKDDQKAWLGASILKKDGRSVLNVVFNGGSAHAAGLMPEDEILALDGHKVGLDLDQRLKAYQTGETVEFAVFRRGRLVQGTMEFLADPHPKLELKPVEGVTDDQKKSFSAWVGADWPFDKKDD